MTDIKMPPTGVVSRAYTSATTGATIVVSAVTRDGTKLEFTDSDLCGDEDYPDIQSEVSINEDVTYTISSSIMTTKNSSTYRIKDIKGVPVLDIVRSKVKNFGNIEFVLKVMSRECIPDANVELEVAINHRLQKRPNIVKLIYAWRENKDEPCYKLLFWDAGAGLANHLSRGGLGDLKLMRNLVQGVEHIHAAGIVHCDLKPGNLIVHPAASTLKICDFGLSVAVPAYIGHTIQTCMYRAPECFDMKHKLLLSPAVDMWSVGCILWEMVIGVPRFPGSSDAEVLKLIQGKDKDGKSELVSGPLRIIIDNLLSTDPKKRPTAAQLIADPLFA